MEVAAVRIPRKLFVSQTLIIILLVLVPGCRFEFPFDTEEHELEEMWPHRDGLFWSYDYTLNRIGYICGIKVYEEMEDVPAFPTFDEIVIRLGDDPFPGDYFTHSGSYELVFDGKIRTESGATGQNLVATVSLPNYIDSITSVDESASRLFLERLALYRPDLREKIVSMGYLKKEEIPEALLQKLPGPSLVSDIDYILPQPTPFFLHGGAWEMTDEYIGLYGDLDRLLAWKFLEEDLSVGSEFKHRLVPSLADDVFLHCKILEQKTVRTASGVFEDALVCLYAVDYGIGVVHTLNPMDDDYFRIFDYGTVTYAPRTGPVSCYERLLSDVSPSSSCCEERILGIRRSKTLGL
jgi:hypothetical protein